MTARPTEAEAFFESLMPKYQEMFIHAPRREADELAASVMGQSTHIAKIRRQRAGTLRTQATKHEKWVALIRRLGAEDDARRRSVAQ
jgi:hypothetical protein